MIKVEELNENIYELEKEIKNIKSVSEVFNDLNKLSLEVKADAELHNAIIQDISSISKEIESSSKTLNDLANKHNQTLEEIRTYFDDTLTSIVKSSNDANAKLNGLYEKFIQNIRADYEKQNKDYLDKIGQLMVNIEANADKLSKDINNQLDKNQRIIGSEIKNLNYEIQNSIVNFINTKSESIESKFLIKKQEDQANFKVIKILSIVSILFSVISIVVVMIK
jgi:ABC-type transporter Mla subunit MlaD